MSAIRLLAVQNIESAYVCFSLKTVIQIARINPDGFLRYDKVAR
jgi:hypothetical protein